MATTWLYLQTTGSSPIQQHYSPVATCFRAALLKMPQQATQFLGGKSAGIESPMLQFRILSSNNPANLASFTYYQPDLLWLGCKIPEFRRMIDSTSMLPLYLVVLGMRHHDTWSWASGLQWAVSWTRRHLKQADAHRSDVNHNRTQAYPECQMTILPCLGSMFTLTIRVHMDITKRVNFGYDISCIDRWHA